MAQGERGQPLGPETEATRAICLLNDPRIQKLPVLEQQHFLGLVRRQDLLRWLAIHIDLAQSTP